MEKNTFNQDKYPNPDDIMSPVGFRRAVMKQLERIENIERAQLTALEQIAINTATKKDQKGVADKLKAKISDLLDDGKLNDSVDEIEE